MLNNCAGTEPTAVSDASLLVRYQAGEPDAAAAIHQRYERRVLGLVRRHWPSRVQSQLDPDDVAQEVFQRFFHAAGRGSYTLEMDGSLWGVLLVTTLNCIRKAASYHSAARRDVRIKLSLDADECRRPSTRSQRLTAEVADVVVADVLEALPAVAREIVNQRLEGYTAVEIARNSKLSLRAVERHLHWARWRVPGLLGLATVGRESAKRPRSA
jgi:RNA polymerase sigma-70 factor, ECF subfamily